nr:DUF1491 family protein [Bartonella sp. HY038]
MGLRLTSDFYVAQLIRKINGANGFAYLVRRGAIEAGTIFIMQRLKNNQVDLFGPAPQSFYEEAENDGGRLFIKILTDAEEVNAIEKLEKELRFDPDIWLVEVENINDLTTYINIV